MKRKNFLKIALLSPLAVVALPGKKPTGDSSSFSGYTSSAFDFPNPSLYFGNGVGGIKFTDNGIEIYKTASMGPTFLLPQVAIQCKRCLFFSPKENKECLNCKNKL